MVNTFPKILPSFSSLVFIIMFLTVAVAVTTSAKHDSFSHELLFSTELGISQQDEKLTHLHFFFHDIVSGTNQTAVRVAAAPSSETSPTGFGSVVMMDDPLTETADRSSKIVGRAQGMYGSASQSELGLLMVMSFAFTEGEYNGSSLSVLGRNTVESAVREMPIVGGSGVFRFCRGYAQAKTHSIDEMVAVVEDVIGAIGISRTILVHDANLRDHFGV
ncbi:Dirigent protein [Arachis hypogaea]|nr:Dirigent protein [Arachis hypogaea]